MFNQEQKMVTAQCSETLYLHLLNARIVTPRNFIKVYGVRKTRVCSCWQLNDGIKCWQKSRLTRFDSLSESIMNHHQKLFPCFRNIPIFIMGTINPINGDCMHQMVNVYCISTVITEILLSVTQTPPTQLCCPVICSPKSPCLQSSRISRKRY